LTELSTLVERITVGIVVKPADLYVKQGTGVPALRSLNVAPGRLVMEDVVHISHDGHSAHEKSQLSAGDVVIVRSGRPGDAAVIPSGIGELNCIDLIICGKSDILDPEYLCALLNSRFGRHQFSAGTAGTAQQHFNVGAFKRFRVPVATQESAVNDARSRAAAAAGLRSDLLSVALSA
jgi:type I restriction enzyme S subunit